MKKMSENKGWSRKPKNFSKGEIQNALNHTNSISGGARYLNVCYDTFVRYAKRYNLFEKYKNQSGRGVLKTRNVKIKKPLSFDYQGSIYDKLYHRHSD